MSGNSKNKIYVGSKLYPWQKAVANAVCNQRGTDKVVCVKAHRQCGKSFMCEQILLHYAINYAHTENAMISPTLNQSRNIFREIVNAISESGVIRKKNETLLEIELINGSRIFFRSAEMGHALRGYHVNGILILDEAAYLTDDIAELVLPWRQVSKCPLLVVSTPRLRTGLFYTYYVLGIEKQGNTETIDWNDYDTSILLSEEQKLAYKKILTANQYKSEIEGEFLDMDGMVFTNISDNIKETNEYKKLYVGIDFGTGKGEDYTSITMFNENGEMVFLDYFNDLGTFPQVERLANDIITYKDFIHSIACENNSIGEPLTDLLKQNLIDKKLNGLVAKIKPFVTTNDSKADIVAKVQVGLERNEIKLLNDKVLISQMVSYEATYNFKTGKITYNGAQNTHDDTVMSTMIAYNEYYENNKIIGQYKVR